MLADRSTTSHGSDPRDTSWKSNSRRLRTSFINLNAISRSRSFFVVGSVASTRCHPLLPSKRNNIAGRSGFLGIRDFMKVRRTRLSQTRATGWEATADPNHATGRPNTRIILKCNEQPHAHAEVPKREFEDADRTGRDDRFASTHVARWRRNT